MSDKNEYSFDDKYEVFLFFFFFQIYNDPLLDPVWFELKSFFFKCNQCLTFSHIQFF